LSKALNSRSTIIVIDRRAANIHSKTQLVPRGSGLLEF
jgi:hypothetical protein